MLLSSASGPCLHGRLSSNVRRPKLHIALMKALFSVVLILLTGSGISESRAQSSEQDVMQYCDARTKEASLQGDERRSLMRECMQRMRPEFDATLGKQRESERDVSNALTAAIEWFTARSELDNARRLKDSQEQWFAFKQSHCAFEESLLSAGKQTNLSRRVSCHVTENELRSAYLRGLSK